MAQPVPGTPSLPLTPSGNDLRSYLLTLTQRLTNLLTLFAQRINGSVPLDGTETMGAPLPLASYTVAGVPSAPLYEGSVIYVSNETGGKTLAFSDGTNWRRVQDRNVVS